MILMLWADFWRGRDRQDPRFKHVQCLPQTRGWESADLKRKCYSPILNMNEQTIPSIIFNFLTLSFILALGGCKTAPAPNLYDN